MDCIKHTAEDYARWLQLANDPVQTLEAREQYREKMKAFLQDQLRGAFQQFANNAPSAGAKSQ